MDVPVESQARSSGAGPDKEAPVPSYPPASAPVPTFHVDELDAATFRERCLEPGRPVLLRGAVEGWEAVRRWRDPEYLATAAGERLVHATDADEEAQVQLPLQRFWREVFAESAGTHRSINGTVRLRGRLGVLGHLERDTETVGLLPSSRHVATKVFAGRDTRCGLHYHPDSEAFLCQVVGKKRVLLFPPEDWGRIYPARCYSPFVSFSRVAFAPNGDWPDLTSFPRLAGTRPMECDVEPGDALFLPIYWWHVVWCLGTAICSTQFFQSSFQKRYLTRMGLRSNGFNRIGGLRLRLMLWRRGRPPGS